MVNASGFVAKERTAEPSAQQSAEQAAESTATRTSAERTRAAQATRAAQTSHKDAAKTAPTKESSHSPRIARRVVGAGLVLAALATIVATVILWPTGETPHAQQGFAETQSLAADSVSGTIVEHTTGRCNSPDVGKVFEDQPAEAPDLPTAAPGFTPMQPNQPIPGQTGVAGAAPGQVPVAPECKLSIIKLTSGPDTGKRTLVETSGQPGQPNLAQGDEILLAIHRASANNAANNAANSAPQAVPGNIPQTPGVNSAQATAGNTYSFLDMNRSTTIWLWLAVAVVLIAVVGMLRGVLSLVGMGITLITLFGFMIPALLQGADPMVLAITAGAVILFPVIFLVHGVNWKSASALAGTLLSMMISAFLANLAISSSQLRGLGDDDNLLILLYVPQVSVTGLLLAGFIIGALGFLNDVTIAQASTAQEIYEASPNSRPMEVFRATMRVGRDHIASMVYTLVLAYLGTALPMSILLSVANRPLTQTLMSDVVATELLRSAIGAIALILAVPITTFIAALTINPREPSKSPT